MKIARIFLTFFLFVATLYSSEDRIKTGLLYEKIFTTKKEATIGSKLWLKQMENDKYKNKMDVIFYEDSEKLIEDYKNKKLDIVVVDAITYYENKKLLNEITFEKWILSRMETIFEEYYLVKNSKSKITLDNLDVNKIYFKNDLSKLWMNIIANRNSIKLDSKIFERIEKPKKLIFNIFFNEHHLSLIPKDVYISMEDLNPQIKEKLTILKKSKAMFFGAMGFTRKEISPKFRDTLNLITSDVNSTKRDLDAVSFINVQKVYPIKDDEMKELDKLYEEYIFYANNEGKK